MLSLAFPTVILLPAFTNLLVAGTIIVIWHHDRRSYLLRWALGIVAYSGGQILVGLRDLIPDFFSIPVATALMVFGAIIIFLGTRQFFGKPAGTAYLWAFTVGSFAFSFYFTFIRPDMLIRVIGVSSVVAAFTAYHGVMILRCRGPSGGIAHTATAINLILLSVWVVGRLAWGGPEMLATHSLAPLMGPFVAVAVVVVGNVGVGLGLATMHSMRLFNELQGLSQTDPLSGLMNRRALDKSLAGETDRALRMGWSLSILMIDIDHFKSVNDRFGHAIGDLAIQQVADAIRAQLRPYDIAARFGGEEFCVVLPHTTAEKARRIGERIRNAPMQVFDSEGTPCPLTVSIGVAALQSDERKGDAMLLRADSALYEAKKAGRNRVMAA